MFKSMRSECGVLLVRLQFVILGVETFERFLAVLGEIWPPDGRDGPREEPWLPLLVGFLPLGGLSPLCLFDFGLEVGCDSILLAYYCVCDAVPEFERFVGELLLERRYDFRDGVERIEVDDGDLLLLTCE